MVTGTAEDLPEELRDEELRDEELRDEELRDEELRELQDALLGTESVEQFLHEMAVLAARLVGGDLSCGMTMQPNGRPVTVACSDPVAARVDEVQYQLDYGPCLHAMRDNHMVRIEDTAAKLRWPEFERQAASHGIRSCLALPLSADGRPVGALNLYAREASAFGAAEAHRARDFAENASGALTLAIRLASYAALVEQLRSSLASRTIIDQALGIVMARERCSQAQAFAILRSASQNSNVKLRDIASAIVTTVSGEPPQPPPAFEENLSAVGIRLRDSILGLCPITAAVRSDERYGHARIYIQQAIDTGNGEHSPHGRCADDQPHTALTGRCSPVGAHQGPYSSRIAKGRRAQVRDQENRTLIQHREQILADIIGIRDVDLRGQRDDGGLADPEHRIVLTGHVRPPSVHNRRAGRVSGPRKAAI